MNYFKEYMLSVCTILVLTSVTSEILVDFSWAKYINLICGILFAVCLVNPLLDLFNIDFSFEHSYENNVIADDFVNENLKKDFLDKFSDELKKDIENTFGTQLNIKGELTNDGTIHISFFDSVTEKIYNYIKQKYKPDKIHILGE